MEQKRPQGISIGEARERKGSPSRARRRRSKLDFQADAITNFCLSTLLELESQARTMLLALIFIMVVFLAEKVDISYLQSIFSIISVAYFSLQVLNMQQVVLSKGVASKGIKARVRHYASDTVLVLGGFGVTVVCALDRVFQTDNKLTHGKESFLFLGLLYLVAAASNVTNLRWGRSCIKVQGTELKASGMQTSALCNLAAALRQVLFRSHMFACITMLLVVAFTGYAIMALVQKERMLILIGMACLFIGTWALERNMNGVHFFEDEDELHGDDCLSLPTMQDLEIIWSAMLIVICLLFNAAGLILLDASHSWLRWMLCLCGLCIMDSTAGLTRLRVHDAHGGAVMKKLIDEKPKSP